MPWKDAKWPVPARVKLIARRLSGQYSAFLIAASVDEAWSRRQRGEGGRLAAAGSVGGLEG